MPIKPSKNLSNKLEEVTARQFDGGLNVVDSQLNLSSKYATVLTNMYRGLDGSLTVRQGTRLFVDVSSIASPNTALMNGIYYNGYIITINNAGEIFKTDGTSVSTCIWNRAIAAALFPARNMWGAGNTNVVTLQEIGGSVVVQNGVDKPLVIFLKISVITVDYLADLATGSNVNVPIGIVMTNYNKHLVVANGSTLNVSDENTSGTFVGDAGAIYAAQFEMKNSVVSGDTTIIALSNYRDWLLVHFKECTVPVQFVKITVPSAALQIADSSDAGGTLTTYGGVSTRSVQNLGDVTVVADIAGVASVTLAQYTNRLSPDRPSRLVDPLIKAAFAPLTQLQLSRDVFSVFNRLESMYMLFVPDGGGANQVNSNGFGYRYLPNLNIKAWNTFEGWNWRWSCRSSEGLMFFGQANSNLIFVMGNVEKLPLNADFIGDQETFSDGTVFNDNTGLTPISDIATSGIPIEFSWNLPWTDLKRRGLSKTLKYLALDTEGSGEFTVSAYINDKYFINNDHGEEFTDGLLFSDETGFIRDNFEPLLTPAVAINYVGADHGGYGSEDYGGDNFGGGRNTSFRRMIQFPVKFNTLKLSFTGATMRPLKIVGITMFYMKGTIRQNTDT